MSHATRKAAVQHPRITTDVRWLDPSWRHHYGLRPTIRHLMVLVLDVALLSALVRLLNGGLYGGLFVLLALSPPLLALLILVFERPGPAKYWLAGLLLSLFLPSLAVGVDVLAAAFWWSVQASGGSFFLSLLLVCMNAIGVALISLLLVCMNAIGVVALIRTAWLIPRRCPECGLCAWLPLGRRSAALLWCASCGFRERAGRPHATH